MEVQFKLAIMKLISSMAAPFTLLSVSLFAILCLATSQPDLLFHFCGNNGNYTNGSNYQTNLNNLLSSLPSAVDPFGFANSTSGKDPERPHAIVLCRGDVQLQDCITCVNNSISKLPQLCPFDKEAVGWYDSCMLRYSNRSITGSPTSANTFFMWNLNNATSVREFNQDLRSLLTDLRSKAATGGSRRKFAAGNMEGPDFRTIYAMMQCTPDLTEKDCSNCLNDRISQINDCCNGKIGGRVINPSCFLRFETSLFYNETAAVQALSPPPPVSSPPPSPAEAPPTADLVPTGNNNGGNNRTVIIVAASISSVVGIMLIIFLWFIFLWKGKRKIPKKKPLQKIDSMNDDMSSTEISQYDFESIQDATDDFSDANRLGQGGFGAVYKGRLSNGQEIAVKRLSREFGQGEQEFKNEIMLVAKLQHRNLVRILGFCVEGTERLLVYELLANSSLDQFLFDPIKRGQLDWQRRYKIIGGVARGLLYLHEDSRVRIIHRDMKASNILLDAEMNPKIADFGMARLSVRDETQGNTSRIVGTYGYMAPEYAMQGKFSVKSDVFSFGILVLEIVSGKKNNSFHNGEDFEDILSFAWKCWRDGNALNMIDPMLRDGGGSIREMIRCIHIGLLCTQNEVVDRPTMASVVLMFNSFSLTLPVPSEPAFFMHRRDTTTMSPLYEGNSRASEESGLMKSSGSIGRSEQFSGNVDSISEMYPR